ncbi:hypothetical protein P4V47_16355 [Brevibacillus laterosporus]|uniref:hypothetical protein n=1 Tax=Brevibacillus laterosporus TaxID=1465 RepID=UPI002E1FAE9A|nr:hypothetical protein [Brevibacillus laterosporus]
MRLRTPVITIALTALLSTISISDIKPVLSKEKYFDYEAKTFFNLDDKGEKLDTDNFTKSSISLENIKIKKNRAVIKGSVAYNEMESLPFELEGEIFKGKNSNQLIVGKLEDKLDNFDVILFSIDRSPQGSIILDKEIKENVIANSEDLSLLKIYLLKKDSRDFTVLETRDIELFNVDKIFDGVDELEKADHIDEFWYSKILAPETEIEKDNGRVKRALQNASKKDTLVSTYYISGGRVQEKMVLRYTLEGPKSFDSTGQFTHKVYVEDEFTKSSDFPSMNSNDTSTEVGVYGDTIVEGITGIGDVIRYVQWDGEYIKPGFFSKPSISIGWSLAALGASVGASSSWTYEEKFNRHSMKNFDNTGKKKVRKGGVVWEKNKAVLKDKGHSFDHIFGVGHYENRGTKEFAVKTTLTWFNPMKEKNRTETFSKTVSLDYNSK